MKIKEFINDKSKILKFAIITAGLALVVLVSVIGMTYATSVPKFCALCHIMKPEFATWQASSHSQVSCTACHVDPGLKSALEHKVVATKELYSYVFKKYELPIQMTEDIPDSRCLKCHSLKRKVSSSTDLNIPHKRHYDNKVSCIKCHQGVAHGKVASSGMTIGGDFNQWTKSKAAGLMTVENTLPRMDLCMDCHGRRGVTVACEACHSGSMKPDSHQEKAFKTTHGKQAKKNIKYCSTCHDFIKAPGVTSNDLVDQIEDPVAKYLNSMQAETGSDSGYVDYAKTNEYCVECHKKRPPGHNDQWPFEHGKAAEKDNQKCLICHSPRSDIQGTTPTAACSSCHPSIHKAPWRDAHPIPVPQRYAILDPVCLQCHVEEVCSSCHGIREKNKVVLPPAARSQGSEQTGSQSPADNPGNNGPPDNSVPVVVPPVIDANDNSSSNNKPVPQAKVIITPISQPNSQQNNEAQRRNN